MDRNYPGPLTAWGIALVAYLCTFVLTGAVPGAKDEPPDTPPALPLLLPLLESGRLDPERASHLLEAGVDEVLREIALHSAPLAPGACVELASIDGPTIPDSLDVIHYDIAVTSVDEVSLEFLATTTVTLRAARAIEALDLELINQTVASLEEESSGGTTWNPVPFTHDGFVIHAGPLSPLAEGDTLRLRVTHAGSGSSGCSKVGSPLAGVVFSTVGVHTFSEPAFARYWYPCHDVPWDRATFSITMPPVAGRVASASGMPDTPVIVDGIPHSRWTTPQPVSTYLAAFYLGDYVTLADTSAGGVPLEYFTYPHLLDLTRVDYANVPDMMDFYSTFHPYPNPRYAMSLGFFGGGMEHIMNALIGYFLIHGDRRNESLWAHELAHQWWGDYVTLATWRDIWLNEGFATYFDLLYAEHRYGWDAMRTRIAFTDSAYKARPEFDHPILDPPPNRLLSSSLVIYHKGARVLDMLRAVSRMRLMNGPAAPPDSFAAAIAAGDERFFRIFSTYAERHPWQNVSTADFRAVVEETLGEDLGWYFAPWLQGTSYPTWEVDWDATSQSDGVVVEVHLRQRSADTTRFEMPLPVRYRSEDRVLDEVRWIAQGENSWVVTLPPGEWRVEIDPEDWILDEIKDAPLIPADRGLTVISANPSSSGFLLTASQTEPGPVPGVFTIHDLAGRQVRRLDLGSTPPGPLALHWDGRSLDGTRVASGVYFGRLRLGTRTTATRLVVVR